MSGRSARLDHEASQRLLLAIGKARRWMAALIDGSIASTGDIAATEQMGERDVRKLLPLACLSPTIISAIARAPLPPISPSAA